MPCNGAYGRNGFPAGMPGLDLLARADHMKKFLFLVVLVAAGFAGLTQYRQFSLGGGHASGVKSAATEESASDGALERAQESRASGVQLQGQGTVIKVLPDDNDGSRHQRFILKLRSGQTLLIAHNIDLAPRIGSLRAGDSVAFNGEYEWNSKGGVIHWTHHDPGGRHAAGWLKHGGQVYQ
jgi:hypothetical protein